MVIMDTWMCQRRSPPIVVYGDQSTRLHQASTIKEDISILKRSRSLSSSSSEMRNAKVYS
jgi:hypothetical protein